MKGTFNPNSKEESVEKKLNTKKLTKVKGKSKKEVIKENIIEGFENESKDILKMRENRGLDVLSQKCKKCDFETHSEGLLRLHKGSTHGNKETNQNIILGFELDLRTHLGVLEANGVDTHCCKCEICDFQTHSEEIFIACINLPGVNLDPSMGGNLAVGLHIFTTLLY